MLFQQALHDQATNYLGDGAFSHSGRLRQFDTRQGSGPSDMLHDPKRAVVRAFRDHVCLFKRRDRIQQMISLKLIFSAFVFFITAGLSHTDSVWTALHRQVAY
jgi:hypothetical protein